MPTSVRLLVVTDDAVLLSRVLRASDAARPRVLHAVARSPESALGFLAVSRFDLVLVDARAPLDVLAKEAQTRRTPLVAWDGADAEVLRLQLDAVGSGLGPEGPRGGVEQAGMRLGDDGVGNEGSEVASRPLVG